MLPRDGALGGLSVASGGWGGGGCSHSARGSLREDIALARLEGLAVWFGWGLALARMAGNGTICARGCADRGHTALRPAWAGYV